MRNRATFLADAAGLTPLDLAVMQMIRAHVEKPCPTLRDVRDWTGMPERTANRHLWAYLSNMMERGLIEIEVRQAHPEGGKDPKMRRMRVVGEEWTNWTARRPEPARVSVA